MYLQKASSFVVTFSQTKFSMYVVFIGELIAITGAAVSTEKIISFVPIFPRESAHENLIECEPSEPDEIFASHSFALAPADIACGAPESSEAEQENTSSFAEMFPMKFLLPIVALA